MKLSVQNLTSNMKTTTLTSMKKILFAAAALIAFSQCTEEDIVPKNSEAPVAESQDVPSNPTGSFTISGVYTTYEAITDCSTCTFVVPADLVEIDGSKLNLKAGSVICLDKAIKYGDLTFTNLVGTEAKPIVIGACGK